LVQAQSFFIAFSHGIKKSQSLDETPVPFFALIRHYDVVERPFLLAAASQTNSYHTRIFPIDINKLILQPPRSDRCGQKGALF
jgi:hypothetical protein